MIIHYIKIKILIIINIVLMFILIINKKNLKLFKLNKYNKIIYLKKNNLENKFLHVHIIIFFMIISFQINEKLKKKINSIS